MANLNVFKHLVDSLADRALDADAAAPLPAPMREAIAELAFLAVNADGKLRAEEETLLRACFAQLDDPAHYGQRFDAFAEARKRDGKNQRVAAAAATLTSAASKRLAYALVFALGNADLARAPEEERFERQLAQALGLDEAQVASLNDLVMSKLAVG